MGKIKQMTIAIICLLMPAAVYAGGKNSPPPDVPTIEALIDAHKSMKKAEDIAVTELTAIYETQTLAKKAAAKYNETRKMLNQRMADVGSILTLTSTVATIALQLKDLTESYADFTEKAFANAKRHPFLLATYTNANLQIAWEITHITKSCGDFVLFQTNVFKSTMDEKRQILAFIQMHISSVQRIINRASMQCRSMMATGVQEYHVMDIVNSKTNQEIMNKVIGKWQRNAS